MKFIGLSQSQGEFGRPQFWGHQISDSGVCLPNSTVTKFVHFQLLGIQLDL